MVRRTVSCPAPILRLSANQGCHTAASRENRSLAAHGSSFASATPSRRRTQTHGMRMAAAAATSAACNTPRGTCRSVLPVPAERNGVGELKGGSDRRCGRDETLCR